MTRLTIIVPVYKAEKYLDKCINSILKQSFQDYELILVDDGSPDKCGEMCDAYAAQDKRIRVIHQKNQGVSVARNVALDSAKGAYISFVDPDDYIDSDMFEVLFKEIENNHKIDIICFEVYQVRGAGTKISYLFDKNRDIIGKNGLSAILKGEIDNSPCNKLYKKAMWDGVRFPAGRRYEDVATIYKTFIKAANVRYLHRALYYYIKHEGSAVALAFFDSSRRYECFIGYKERLVFAQKLDEETYNKCVILGLETALATLTSFYANKEDEHSERFLDVANFLNEYGNSKEADKLKTKHKLLLWSFMHCRILGRKYASLSAISKRLRAR